MDAGPSNLPPPPPSDDDYNSDESDDMDDPDYVPDDDADVEDDEADDDSDEEEDGEEDAGAAARQLLMRMMGGGAGPMQAGNMPTVLVLPITGNITMDQHEDDVMDEEDSDRGGRRTHRRKRARSSTYDLTSQFTAEEKAYWRKLDCATRTSIIASSRKVRDSDASQLIPMRFKFLTSDMDDVSKAMVLSKLDQFQCMHEGSGEYFKLRNWLNSAARLPLGKHFPLAIKASDPHPQIAGYLQNVRASLDKTVYGHIDTKDQVMRIIAQWVSNPGARGHCIGIQGAMGVGKTSLIKEGICKALGLPFGFVALGGAADGSFLEGHSFTYEGSTYGKIAEVLMKTQCMNPILYFDELDKVSGTRRGDEIIGILTHLTDSSQNERFQDRYFGELELNLSKALIVFSYNDESLINPILKDRMTTIHVKGYTTREKLCIARDYLLPDILQQYNLTSKDIVFDDETLEYIIQRVPEEEGVRNLKRGIETIVGWVNMHRYVPPASGRTQSQGLPVVISEDDVRQYLRPSDGPGAIRPDVLRMMYL